MNERSFIKAVRKYFNERGDYLKNNKYMTAFIFIAAAIIILLIKLGMHDDNSNTDEFIVENSSYSIKENVMKIEAIDIDIKYPVISNLTRNSADSDLIANVDRRSRIDKLLAPPEIQMFYDMIRDGLIKIDDTGTIIYQFEDDFGIKSSYTMGLSNEDFLNIYRRTISYTHNSEWDYGPLLIDIHTGEQIKTEDFFDVDAFREYISNGAFKVNKKDFDILSFFNDSSNEQLKRYLGDAFINEKYQLEIIVAYGEEPETIMYADIKSVMGMIKPKYQEYIY